MTMASTGLSSACCGVYDAEECRDFLAHELGEKIARSYRYAEGIHEVQKRLILRYGDENIARAMSVFKELLENDNASGLGDYGDAWRSWRHDYKLRGEDLANPGTPRFPGIILPAIAPIQRRHTSIPITIPVHAQSLTDQSACQQTATRVLNHAGWFRNAEGRPERPISQTYHTPGAQQGIDNFLFEAKQTINLQKHLPQEKSSRIAWYRSVSAKISGLFHKGRAQRSPIVSKADHSDETRAQNSPAAPNSSRLHSMGLDGASDGYDNTNPDDNSHDKPTTDINRALQPSPLRPQRNLMAAENRRLPHLSGSSSSQDRSTTSTNMYSTSSSSANHSMSSRDGFRSITRDLLSPGSAAFYNTMLGDFSPLDPAKYNPSPEMASSVGSSDPYSRYASIINGNPFAEEHAVPRPSFADDQHLHTHTPYNSPPKARGLGQSRSEVNIAFIHPTPVKNVAQNGRSVHFEEQSPVRGRQQTARNYMDELTEEALMDGPASRPRRSRSPMKKMFGENGWLGRSTSMKEVAVEHDWKSGFKQLSGKLKQRVEGITEDMTKLLPNPFNLDAIAKGNVAPSKFPISLDPPSQSRLYGELELMLCVTANVYLMQQRKQGRMSVESLIKVTDMWKSKGRPQVVEFQFDQATQRDLVLYNLKTFRFYGENADNRMAINSMMYNWKTLAKEMSVRTFCTPDSVIRKHLHDSYRILELLGAPLTTFLAFQEMQVSTLKLMRDEQKRREEKLHGGHGIERVWHPPQDQIKTTAKGVVAPWDNVDVSDG